jgi:cyclic beta-1,2-glucan synthetase
VDACEAVAIALGDGAEDGLVYWANAVQRAIASHQRDASEAAGLAQRARAVAADARRLVMEMDFRFLLDPDRMLLSIGYRAAEGELDPTCYDLLGSEARLASFVAIAKGDVPAKHWFRLSHAVTPVGNGAALISWSGSMFEYLMPSLVMRVPPGSVIAQTNRLVVRRQMDYAAGLHVPWGVSESAYNARDLELTYQYLSFGIPSLGLKRGLADHVVIAPYATALAAMVAPGEAARNLAALSDLGGCGRYGYYEALDFTPERVPDGQRFALVRAFMAHHQGMTIAAIGDVLCDGAMRRRFHAEPMIQATELLLEERMPREVVISQPWVARGGAAGHPRELDAPGGRRITSPHTPSPATHLLSNGAYSVMLTAAGSGYSRWRDLAVTRWREDATTDRWGAYVFLRDMQSGVLWSAGWQPTGAEPDSYEAVFNEDRCEFIRRDAGLQTTTEVLVSPEDDGEVRRVSISNRGFTAREIEVTSYAEVVLAPQVADVAHPAFSNLFIETEHLPGSGALLAHRRRRSPEDPEVWAAHLAVVEGERIGALEFDTDRAQVLGRGRDLRAPRRIAEGAPLGGAVGDVLDPIFALRRRVRIPPGGTARVSFWTLVADSRKAILDLVDKQHDVAAFDRALNLAWTQALVQLHHLGVSRGEAALFQRLAGHILHAGPALRSPARSERGPRDGQPGLWRMAISGDLPIVVVRIGEPGELALARQVIKAGEHLRSKQLAFDLVFLNERGASYVQDLQVALEALVRADQSHAALSAHSPAGRTVVLRADLIAPESRDLLLSVARVVLQGQAGGLLEQLDRASDRPAGPTPAVRRDGSAPQTPSPEPPDLEFANGIGGFADGGREYVTVIRPGQQTPAPWINVIANRDFGFQVSADGAGYTWSRNSREHQLTPWSNDPVGDPASEAIFIRDEDTGEVWSPTPAPIRDEAASYVCRHGRGYSRFEHLSHGVACDLLQFVLTDAPAKVTRLRLRNVSARARRVSVTTYAEWALGASRAAAAPFTRTAFDNETGAVFARNDWNPAFGETVAFSALGARPTNWTADRREFLGRNGSLATPAALAGRVPMSQASGLGLDPCAALQVIVELPPGGSRDVLAFLGEETSEAAARILIARCRALDPQAVLEGVSQAWEAVTGALQVKTPDPAMDVMLNGWLAYQTLACRIWGRAGFYQASGAYGFRDQLQDGMALAATQPQLVREHLLRAAARQFAEGDVQHWWLPHSGQGVRTRISDDRIWLAYATAHYVETTGDADVLDEQVAFLSGPPLENGDAESFFQPSASEVQVSLYEHGARAVDASLDLGGHGLPLIGAGDWNDGFNRVGARGRGESVWLGWFLHAAIDAFLPLAEARSDRKRVAAWRAHAAALAASLERSAWDGGWYRRGWFDDGAPLGSAASDECRIDSIAQSWAVISGAAPEARAREAMAALDRELIRRDEGLALLFTPPFDRSPRDPGYIKAYPPGVRENGGQYTHAAAWAVIAFAMLGEGEKAHALFELLNPINHARSRAAAHRYRVEPYVVAADVYSVGPHVGRGGWTWYTGSAAWLQRAGVEWILGLRRKGDELLVEPCIPADWPGFEAVLRRGEGQLQVVVENPDHVRRGVAYAEFDGRPLAGRPLVAPFAADGASHRLVVRLGANETAQSVRTAARA